MAITSTSVSSLELEVSSLELLAWPVDTVPEGGHRGLRTLLIFTSLPRASMLVVSQTQVALASHPHRVRYMP